MVPGDIGGASYDDGALSKRGAMEMTIQAVFFDMGGTIETFWYTRDVRLEATPGIQNMLLAAGIDLHLNTEQLYDLITDGLVRYHHWRTQTLKELPPLWVWRDYILSGYPVDHKKLDAIAEALTVYIETHYYRREMRPEIPKVLDIIQKMGLKIGLISNVSSRGQVPCNLEKYGIRHYFDPIVLSSIYGRRKPDPAIFHYAARMARVPAGSCVYVGDRVARDIVGARKAGYKLAIQINHDFKHGEADEGAPADAVIFRMTELVDILQTEISRFTKNAQIEAGPSNPIRAMLFDAGDILYFRPNRGHKITAFLEELALNIEDIPQAKKQSIVHQAYQGQIDQDQYREAILRMYGVTQPEQVKRGKRILDEDENNIQFFDGVRKTLLALKAMGYLLGVVTDTAAPVHVKLSWFERGGFGHIWDSIISSAELGICKPDPQIYQAALGQLGLHPAQAVFVGHNASELEGARAVGMKTVAFNYDEAAKADYYIEHFAGLLELPFVDQSEAQRS
jgi:putative hydrolase of the HAD superfamily